MKTKTASKTQKCIKINNVDVPMSIFQVGSKLLSKSWVENNIANVFSRAKVPLTARASDLAKRYSNDLTPTANQYEWFCGILEELAGYFPDKLFAKEWSKSELELLEDIDKAIEKGDKDTYTKSRDKLLQTRTIDEIAAIITVDIRLRKYHNASAELKTYEHKVSKNNGLIPTTVYLSQGQIAALKKYEQHSEVGLNYGPGDILQRLIGDLMGETALDTALAHTRYSNMINMYSVYRSWGR